MKSHLTRMLAIAAIGFVTVVASAAPASAQNAAKGAFTLPSEVRWQGRTLPAGDYTFTMKSAAVPAQIFVKGPNASAFILTISTSKTAAGERSFLTLERRGSISFVREMYLAELGVHFRYSAPRIPKDEQQLAQGPASTEQVLIATTQYIHK